MRWLRFRFLRAWRHQRQHSHQWMSRHPRCARLLTVAGCLRTEADALARGVAIGMFIGLTPTVGAQILLMILGCTIFRGNFLAAFAVSWVSNPLTMGPLYYGWNQIGEVVFGPLLAPLAGLAGLSGDITEESVTTFLGSLVMAAPGAIIGYLLALWGFRRRNRRKPAAGSSRAGASPCAIASPISPGLGKSAAAMLPTRKPPRPAEPA